MLCSRLLLLFFALASVSWLTRPALFAIEPATPVSVDHSLDFWAGERDVFDSASGEKVGTCFASASQYSSTVGVFVRVMVILSSLHAVCIMADGGTPIAPCANVARSGGLVLKGRSLFVEAD